MYTYMGWTMAFLFILPFLYLTKCCENDTVPSVEIPQGKIRGTWKTTINGRYVQAFLGIPYAKPPLGELRFRNPEPADNWNTIHDGTKEPSLCLQFELFAPNIRIIGSEDCLYLNVYTPAVSNSEKYPVMVFIHGGAFQSGGCISDYYGPDMLLDKNIVLVTINYRIGILGFASMEDEEMSGNYGLKDQQLALKWVKNNIEFFGGNSDSITIFGESTGSASVHYQMLSPMSKGLFHRAILMSGSADCTWALSPVGFMAEQTRRLGSLVNCSFSSSKDLVECLRKVPAELFVYSLFQYIIWPGFDPIVVFKPVLEPEGSEEAFITRSAYLKSTSDIPMMAGVTSEDGSFKVAILYATKKIDELLSQLDSEWLKLAPYTMFYYASATNMDEVSKKIRNYYFKSSSIDRSKVPELVKMFSDSWFHRCTLSAIKRHKGPTFSYKFAHKGDNSVTFFMTNSTFNYGVTHADDLIYLFPLKNWVTRHSVFSEKDKEVSETMVDMFTNFASYGKPTVEAKPVMWNPTTYPDNEYMIIQGENYRIGKKFLMESDELWNELSWRDKIFHDVIDTDKTKIET